VDAFDTHGTLIRRVASRGELNSPWGRALAPADFGRFGNDLLVGNFGNGRVHAFDPGRLERNGEFQQRGALQSAERRPIAIDGLWALGFGKGAANNGPTNTLFFTAGPDGEQHGLVGTLVAAPRRERERLGTSAPSGTWRWRAGRRARYTRGRHEGGTRRRGTGSGRHTSPWRVSECPRV